MSTDLPGLGSNRMQAMVYGYDQLHRIVQARSLTEYGVADLRRELMWLDHMMSTIAMMRMRTER